KNTLIKASILGLLGVVLYFLPIQLFPYLFPFYDFKNFLGLSFRLEYGQLIFGILLMVLELHLLVLVNLKSVHELANVTGFYSKNKDDDQFLIDLGLGSKELGLNNYGIDPYQEVNTKLLFIFNLLLKLKGFLANKLLQYLFKRLMGRYAVRYAIDYIGIPVYMFLNALGAYTILNEAKICILGSNYVTKFNELIQLKSITNEAKELIYDTLQLIAMSKRDYHKNHYLLTAQLFKKFDIKPVSKRVFTQDYYQKLAQSPEEIQDFCKKIIVLGFILDGKISNNEHQKIKTLENFGLMKFNSKDLTIKCNQFKSGVYFEL
ncbi:MAG: LBF_2804 family protein, partial [Flavobacterium sp.]